MTFTGDALHARLRDLGLEQLSVSSDGTRALLGIGLVRVVVPLGDRIVPGSVLRMLDSALAPVLGHGRVTTGARALESDDRVESVVVLLDAVVLVDQDEGWRAFLAEEPGIVGFGSTREAALRDLKESAALRLDTTPDAIALLTPTVV